MKLCTLYDLSNKLMSYSQVWQYQKSLQHLIFSTKTSSKMNLILSQHHPVYTIGRGADLASFKFNIDDSEHEVYRTERGGDVTWHGPGQLVAYPVLDLSVLRKDLRWYVRSLEQVVIDSLKEYDIEGCRDDVNSGVFVGTKKIAAVGIAASKWVTMHGIALNINCSMESFQQIVPCGIRKDGYGVCRLQDVSAKITDFNIARSVFLNKFCSQFDVEFDVSNDPMQDLEEILSQQRRAIKQNEPIKV